MTGIGGSARSNPMRLGWSQPVRYPLAGNNDALALAFRTRAKFLGSAEYNFKVVADGSIKSYVRIPMSRLRTAVRSLCTWSGVLDERGATF
jgi:hypothetical protein